MEGATCDEATSEQFHRAFELTTRCYRIGLHYLAFNWSSMTLDCGLASAKSCLFIYECEPLFNARFIVTVGIRDVVTGFRLA